MKGSGKVRWPQNKRNFILPLANLWSDLIIKREKLFRAQTFEILQTYASFPSIRVINHAATLLVRLSSLQSSLSRQNENTLNREK